MVRELIVTLPDRLRLSWRMFLAWLEAAELCLIDRRLARCGEERTLKPLAFDEIPTLYDEADFPVVTDDVPGWSGNSTPEGVTVTDSPWFDYA
jgi:hypothetical protein